MLPKDSIVHMQQTYAELSDALASQLKAACDPTVNKVPAVVLPENHNVKILDIEKYLPNRTRFRGVMVTENVAEFAQYCELYADEYETDSSHCYVNAEVMCATTFFDLGTVSEAGHCEHQAKLDLRTTAEYRALLNITRDSKSQQAIAEFLEDWRDNIICVDADGNTIPIATAISAIRKIKINAKSEMESDQQNFSSSRSALENINANNDGNIPHFVIFKCKPYADLNEREFHLRVALHVKPESDPQIKLNARKLETIEQEMAEEFADLLKTELPEEINTFIATFKPN